MSGTALRTGFVVLLAVAGCAVAGGRHPEIAGIEEASGITRAGDRLLVVSDHEPGVYYSCPLAGATPPRLPIDPTRLARHRISGSAEASDLESIGVLADGRIVLISEDLVALVDADGMVARYDERWAELGGRGVEGLAVRSLPDGSSRVAIGWEGGYPEARFLPRNLRERLRGRAWRPRVLVHDLAPGQRDLTVGPDETITDVELLVPEPPGEEPAAQRFRLPDLVWHRWPVDGEEQWGFIALLSSGWAEEPPGGSEAECPKQDGDRPARYCYRILQRFTRDGRPHGEAFDLEPLFPEATRFANWEGLGWFVPGESLVLIYDEKLARRRLDPQEALVVPLPAGW